MKQFIALIVVLSMIVGLYACGQTPAELTEQIAAQAFEAQLPAEEPVSEAAAEAPASEVVEAAAESVETAAEPEKPAEEQGEAELAASFPDYSFDLGDAYVYPKRTPVAYTDMKDDTFDSEAFDAAVADMNAKCNDPDALVDLKYDFCMITEQFDRAVTDFSLVQIAYQCDFANEEIFERYNDLSLDLNVVSDDMCNAVIAALNGPCGEELESFINSDKVVADILSHVPLTDEQQALTEENNALTDEYYDKSAQELDNQSVVMGELYLKIIDNLMADVAFYPEYDSAVEYYYDKVYMRDYAPEDVEPLYDWVKENGVTLYNCCLTAIILNYMENYTTYFEDAPSEGEMIEKVVPYTSSVSAEAAEIFDTMVELGLYDMAASPDKADGGFTTELIYYGVPFIFDCPYECMWDYETLIHESGHYYESALNDEPQLYQYDCIDLCEIDSQGMEALMLRYADDIYGEGMGDFVRVFTMYNLLNSIIDGCVQDCFQQRAFEKRASGELKTGEDVVNLYLAVEEEFWGDAAEDYGWGENWWEIHHTFDSPFYYISYATSATAALGILASSEEDYDAALENYNEFVRMGNAQGFENTLDVCGMLNPLDWADNEELTEVLTDYFAALMGEDAELIFAMVA